MKLIRLLLILSGLWISAIINAQSIKVNPAGEPASTMNAEDLTVDVLIDGGSCSSIFNFQLKENPSEAFPSPNRSWGYFEKGNSDFPFEKGIVLTSGYARDAEGPSTGIVSQGGYNWDGDSQANTLANSSTNNATVFEFDFIPFGNHISFNYIFASEEYPGFACSSYNDVFGFIISGPGITNDPGMTGKNIALLPNGQPVTINTVNDSYCGDSTYYVAGNFPYIEYGGRTTVLTAESDVIPGETYHIRLLVADAGDTAYDSAVFLEAGSFNLGSTLSDIEGEDLGEDLDVCGESEFTIVANVVAPNPSFQWYFNGEIITGATSSSYTASETGYYSVVIISEACQTEVGIYLEFLDKPEVETIEVFHCSATGSHVFNLTEFEPDISVTPNTDFSYYTTFLGAANQNPEDLIPDPANYTVTGNVIVYVRVQTSNSCFEIAELELEVGVGPETQPQDYTLCDDDGDGFAEFDLTSQENNLVISSPDGLTFEYYLDPDASQLITNPENFVNTINPQPIFVKIFDNESNGEDCVSIEILTLFVNEFPELQADEIEICDNLNDSSEFIDLTQNNIVVTQGVNVNLQYYDTIGGAQITDPENYEVTVSPTTIYVFVRNSDGSCEDYQTITINFMDAPEVTEDIIVIENCSLSDFTMFYLPDLNEELIEDTAGLIFTYHISMDDAVNGVNPLPENYQNISANQIIFIRVENENGCYDIGQAQLTTVLVHEELEDPLTVCDDPYEESDGVAVFDLTLYNNEIESILGGNGYTISYFTTLDDAVAGNNPIQNPENFQNTTNPQTIYAQASSGDGGCAGVVDFAIQVLPVPVFELPDNLMFCSDEPHKVFNLAGSFETYAWFDPYGEFVGNTQQIDFQHEGIYTLEVTSEDYDCPAKREVEVTFDEKPVIIEIKVDGHIVTVYAAGGFGPYKYSYNNGLSWSDYNVISNVPGGIYEMIVMSKYGCVSEAKMFGVLGIPNFISPNGDGKNDFWYVRGLEAYPNTHIKIFDRYGKMFVDRKLEPGFIWDGKYKGENVASDDYWYIITLEDGRIISGHISVRNN